MGFKAILDILKAGDLDELRKETGLEASILKNMMGMMSTIECEEIGMYVQNGMDLWSSNTHILFFFVASNEILGFRGPPLAETHTVHTTINTAYEGMTVLTRMIWRGFHHQWALQRSPRRFTVAAAEPPASSRHHGDAAITGAKLKL